MNLVRHLSLAALVVLSACEQDRVEIRAGGPIASAAQEIQGGTLDTTSTNVVAILLNTSGGVGICSGSLIAPNLVLTAHHCVADSTTTSCSSSGFGATFSAASFRVTTSGSLAEQTLNQGVWPSVNNSTWYGASVVSVPPTPANNICGGDMALIRLSTNITGICPLIPRVDAPVTLNEAYTAVGFGLTSPTGQTSGTRYTVSGLNVLCEDNCGAGTNATLEWVGGSSLPRGVCEGDSGGPALDSLRRVVGTVSRGDASSCNQALYESVFGQAAWIKSQAAAAATAGGYTAASWVTGGSTAVNPCTGVDGGTGGGAGGGGGATGGGAGGGGGSTGTCNAGTTCVDASGAGDYACLTSGGGLPPNAPACSQTVACPGGYSCWQTGTSSFACLQDCAGGPPLGGGAGGGTTGGGAGGGTATGGGAGGGGGTGGACTNAATTCVDASGQGNFACVDVNSSTGIPAGAASCSASAPCASNYSCWGTANGNFCLQDCTPGGTGGGGGGSPVGGGAGGGVPVGGGAGGGTPVGGGAGGGTFTGGGAGGGTPVGGGSGGGTFTGGGTGTGGAGGSGGAGGAGGGFMFPGLPDKPKPTGCSCSEVPSGVIWLALSGLTLIRRRRPSRVW